MIIGVDIDDVLCPLKEHFCSYTNQRFGVNIDWRNSHYHFGHEMGWSHEKSIEEFRSFARTQYFELIPPIEGAVQGIKNLSTIGRKLYAVTSRHDSLKDVTKKFLDTYFLDSFSDVEFGNLAESGERSKLEMCKKIGARMLIEDQVKYAEQVSHSIPVVLFDRPWNHGFEAENVYRAKNWEEIVKIVDNIIKINPLLQS